MTLACSLGRIQLLVFTLSILVITSTLIVSLALIYPNLVRQRVIDSLLFKNNSDSMSRFADTRDLKNLRMVFYVYNVTNPHEAIHSGAKVHLQELGPFVYHEFKHKEFVNNNQTSGAITYRLRRRYTLDLGASISDPRKLNVTWPNVPLVVVKTFLDKLPPFLRATAYLYLNIIIDRHKEGAFLSDSVDNLLFNGSKRTLFEDLEKLDRFKIIKPWPLKDNKFAMLYGKNDTWNPATDRELTVSAGFGLNQTYKDLNQFTKLNGSATLPFWSAEPSSCNQLHGTDGQFFAPFMNPTDDLEVFSPDICRKISFKYSHGYSVKGIPTLKYILSPDNLQSGLKNPQNLCYCLSRSQNNTLDSECKHDGLIDLSTCVTPGIFASGAHFIHGSPDLLNRIEGVSEPNLSLHQASLYVEPNFGLTVKADVPLQFNVKMVRGGLNIFEFLGDSEPLIMPLFWVAERSEATDDQAGPLRISLMFLDSWLMMMIVGGASLLIVTAIVCVSILAIKLFRHRERAAMSSERQPLLR